MILKKQKNFYKKKIIFITDNIFNFRDYNRYGINFLNKKLDVKIFSLNKNYINGKNVFFFKSFNNLKKKILLEKPSFVVDLMFPSYQSYLIKKILKNKGTKLIKLKLSTYPLKKKKLIERFFNIFNKNQQLGGNIFVKLKNNFYNKLNSLVSFDYYFVDSKLHINKDLNSKIIKGHSLDYDIFLRNKKKIKKQKIIFLDSNVVGHTDYSVHSTKSPVKKEKYLKEINNFLSSVEKIFKQKILIAANPKSNHLIIKKNFKNRKVYINKSFNLIKDAKIVFTHKSTAVSFALCMQKKIIFLTSDDLNKTWYGDQIKYQADLLGSSLLNINSKEDIKDKLKIKINKPKYKRYIQRYIKYPGTKNIYNWNLFLQKLS